MKFNKENINSMITTFCRIVTTIFIACCVYCSFFWKNTRIFSVTDIFCILMIGFTSVLYLIPFYSQKERSKKALFILQIIYFLEINIIVALNDSGLSSAYSDKYYLKIRNYGIK